MVAVGNGARASIEEQVAAAGMNVITVTAGNYKMKGDDPAAASSPITRPLAISDHRSRRPTAQPAVFNPDGHVDDVRLAIAPRRRPDGEAQPSDRAAAARRLRGRSGRRRDADARRCGRDPPRGRAACSTWRRPCTSRRASCSTGAAGSRGFTAPSRPSAGIRRSWAVSRGRFFTDREANREQQVVVLGSVVVREAVRRRTSTRSAARSRSGTSRSQSSASSRARAGRRPARSATTSSTRSTCRSTTVHRLLNLTQAEHDHDHVAVGRRDHARGDGRHAAPAPAARHRRGRRPTTSSSRRRRPRRSASGMNQQIARAIAGNVPGLEQVTLEQLSTHARAIEPHDDGAAGERRRGVAARRRHRHHEHHAALGDRAHARDRPAHGRSARAAATCYRSSWPRRVTLSLVGGALGVAIGLVAAGGVRQAAAVVGRRVSRAPWSWRSASRQPSASCFGLYPARQAVAPRSDRRAAIRVDADDPYWLLHRRAAGARTEPAARRCSRSSASPLASPWSS